MREVLFRLPNMTDAFFANANARERRGLIGKIRKDNSLQTVEPLRPRGPTSQTVLSLPRP